MVDTLAASSRFMERGVTAERCANRRDGEYGDSDVDIAICCTDSYYYDLDQLSPAEKDAFNRTLSAGEGLSSDTIRREVLGWPRKNYANQVRGKEGAQHRIVGLAS
jgi:hypothetical protein